MERLSYENVGDALLSTVPEIRTRYDEEFRDWGDERPGQYLLFGLVLNPFLFPILETGGEGKEEILTRTFAFFEKMAKSSDLEVVNLLWVEELEPLVTKPHALSRAWRYMGERTKALAKETARIWKSEQNLPEQG
jgi:hypothetical protein